MGNAEGFTLSDGSKIDPLKPETIKTLEIGYKDILFRKKLYLDVDAYYNWSKNLISPIINIVPNGRSGGPVVTFRGDRPITDFTQGIVITSYSIHYTKLYDITTSTTIARQVYKLNANKKQL